MNTKLPNFQLVLAKKSQPIGITVNEDYLKISPAICFLQQQFFSFPTCIWRSFRPAYSPNDPLKSPQLSEYV